MMITEEYLEGYVTLEVLARQHLSARESCIVLEQLLHVVKHALHAPPLRICHRDIKPDNILVHPRTLHLKLLDLGLATPFSAREPRLTTCAGSPAYHSPEIVKGLMSPPGSVRYWVSYLVLSPDRCPSLLIGCRVSRAQRLISVRFLAQSRTV
jgi:serine/threonine protein kinase